MCKRISLRSRWRNATLCAALLVSATAAAQSWKPWVSPVDMARIDTSMLPVERSSFCSENCRYDRHGVGGEPAAGNPRPNRWLYVNGGEAVLYDDPGAGVITRIWLTSGGPLPTCLDTSLRVHIYFGGASVPLIDMPLAKMFDANTPPFTPPLTFNATTGSGGYTSYVPIPYQNGIRVALVGLDEDGPCSKAMPPSPPRLWYQIDAQRLPPGTIGADFNPASSHQSLRDFLTAAGTDPWQRGLPAQLVNASIAPSGTLSLGAHTGSGWLAGVRIKLASVAGSRLTLEIMVDGEAALMMPLNRVFATEAADPVPPQSPIFGLDDNDWLYLWWPIPYRQQVQVRLLDQGLTQSRAVQAQLFWDSSVVPDDAGHFFARRHNLCSFGEHHQQRLLALQGSGRLFALAGRFNHATGNSPAYLEGDTRLRFDSRVAPAWQGSGLEDFYNGGFYFQGGTTPYRQPWSGASTVDISGVSAMWRLLLADAPTFANGFKVLQEAGASPAEALDVCMDTVAYGYQTPARTLVPVARLEVGNPNAVARFAYQPPPSASCTILAARFADAASTARNASVCRYASGNSAFHMSLPEASSTWRLRRIVDAEQPGQAARIVVNGLTAGYFPPVRPDSVRRWQEQDAPLAIAPSTLELDIEIQPLWGAHGDTGTFSESVYELWAVPGDLLFADGFEP